MKKYLILAMLFCFVFALTGTASAQGGCTGLHCHSTAYTERIGGADRIETAIKISTWGWEDGSLHGNSEVFICRSDDFPDALAAASLAGWFNAPILINASDELDERVEDELERLYGDFDDLGEEDVVYLVGGAGVLSTSIEEELEDLGFNVKRLGGKNRYETAVEVAEELESTFDGINHILVCTGENWPDALAASAWSYNTTHYYQEANWPIMLVKEDEIPGPTLEWILSHKNVDAYVIGGPGVISPDVMEQLGFYLDGSIERVAGNDRYETCIELAEHPDLWDMDRDVHDWSEYTFCTGSNFPDALAACSIGYPVILTSSIDEAVEDYLDDRVDNDEQAWGYVIGEKGAIDKETEDDIAELLSDGTFEPTSDEPVINSFDVTIDPDNDIPDVGQFDEGDWINFEVETDENIWNQDEVLGKVVVEDISELGGNEAPYNEEDFELFHIDGTESSDNTFVNGVEIDKKHTSPEERDVTFTAKASNQAGSDTMESDSVAIYN